MSHAAANGGASELHHRSSRLAASEVSDVEMAAPAEGGMKRRSLHTSHSHLLPPREESHLEGLRRDGRELVDHIKRGLPRGRSGWLAACLPCLSWAPKYDWRANLLRDIMAGVAATVMTVPEGIANAGLAGAPAQFGLYASVLPSLLYAVFGSCNQQSVGAVAIACMTLGNGIIDMYGSLNSDPNDPADPALQEKINRTIVQVSLFVGTLLLGGGLLQLGFFTNLMSNSVISGYLAGAALIVIMSQLKHLFGVETPHSSTIQGIIQGLADNISGFNWRDCVMGLSFTFFLIACKEIGHRNHKLWWLKPAATLLCLIVGIGVMNIFKLYDPPSNPLVDPLGSVPKGFPPVTISWWGPVEDVQGTFAVTGAVLGVIVIETIAMNRRLAQQHGNGIHASKEFRALGIINFAAAMFSTVPTSGSMSRAAVVNTASGRTPLSSLITGLITMIITIWFTGIFTNMPMNLAGAIMISAVYGMLHPGDPIQYFLTSRFDLLCWATAFLMVIFLGVLWGMVGGVILAIGIHIYHSAHPPMVVLGRMPGTSTYRDITVFPEAEEVEGVLVLRIESALFYACILPVRDWVRKQVVEARARAEARGEELMFVVLDVSATSRADADTIQAFQAFVDELERDGIRLVVVNQSLAVLKKLHKTDIRRGEDYDHHFGSIVSCLHVMDRGNKAVYTNDASAVEFCTSMMRALGASHRHPDAPGGSGGGGGSTLPTLRSESMSKEENGEEAELGKEEGGAADGP